MGLLARYSHRKQIKKKGTKMNLDLAIRLSKAIVDFKSIITSLDKHNIFPINYWIQNN
jgi:hypothetical protein